MRTCQDCGCVIRDSEDTPLSEYAQYAYDVIVCNTCLENIPKYEDIVKEFEEDD
jgi:hypothetical protein